MAVTSGQRLGPYEIVSPLGAGGMGEVWRGRDTRLDREVAIKILPDDFALNENFRVRFEREAKTISSLNHSSICTLFDVGHENGTHFLVMELIDGESLADRLAKGALPPDQVIRYGAQIADALDCAHKQGITHRDLKPANVMLTRSGAKLLDFGLARSGVDASPIQGLTEMPTQAKPLTREGTILGTFQYMAPEQLEGAEADARTDIFALGALLYEMATGQRAFQGSSRTSLIAAIVSSHPPPLSQVATMTPPALDHVIRKCLEKDPEDRWQSARDVASELRWISEAGSQAGIALPLTVRRKNRERLAWAMNLLTAALAILGTWLYFTWSQKPKQVTETAMTLPEGQRLSFGGGLAMSPDGKNVALVLTDATGASAVWLRPISSAQARQLGGTSGAAYPFWSPDSRSVAFFAEGKLKAVDIGVGASRVICDAPIARGGSWNQSGNILLAPSTTGPLMIVPASGGTPSALTKLREGDYAHRWPTFLPNGKDFLFLALMGPRSQVLQSSLDNPTDIRLVVEGAASPGYAHTGHVLYVRGDNLFAQRYDTDKAATIGDPILVADRVAVTDRFIALFTTSNDGTLVLQRGAGYVDSQLSWVDRTGKGEQAITPPGLYFSPALSADARRLAVDVSNRLDGQGDIWTYDLVRNVSTRLTYDVANESSPHFSADGKRIVYYGIVRRSAGNIFSIPSGGTGKPQVVVADDRDKRPTDVSRDGQWLVFNSAGGVGSPSSDIWIWSASENKARPWLETPFLEQGGELSPDAKWMVYESNESGRLEIYVRNFPDGEEKYRISNAGGTMASWRADGREIFYISPERKMMAVAIAPGALFDASTPVALFETRLRPHATKQYDVSADGQRFLVNRMLEAPAEPLAVIQNWETKLE